MNLRTKLSLTFALVVGGILLAFSLGIFFFSAAYREKEFKIRIEDAAKTTASLLLEAETINPEILKIIDRYDLTMLPHEHIVIYDDKNQIIFDSDFKSFPYSKHQQILALILKNGNIHKEIDGHSFFGLKYQTKGKTYYIIASAYDKYGFSKLKYLKLVLISGMILGVFVVLISGWFFSVRTIKPISNINDQVSKIGANSLNQRVLVSNKHDEIGILAENFNKMLNRIEESFAAQKAFVSNASHELRTPLTIITGNIEVTLLKGRTNEEYQTFLADLLDDIKDLNGLSNDLLGLATVGSETIQNTFRTVHLDEIVYQCTSNFMRRNKGFYVQMELDESIEDGFSEYLIRCDELLLRSSFKNIMSNACKFSADNTVFVKLFAIPNFIKITFEDHGIGISPEDLPNIFDAFFRASNAEGFKGHGVGLSLTKKVIEVHGGKISVHSELGKGTTFQVMIPAFLEKK